MRHTRRELRGFGIVSEGDQIRRVNDGFFISMSTCGYTSYALRLEGSRWTCSCPDYTKREEPCKHLYALRASLSLPFILASNSSVTGGEAVSDPSAGLMIEDRYVLVRDAVELYRRLLSELERPGAPFSKKLKPPRLTRNHSPSMGE